MSYLEKAKQWEARKKAQGKQVTEQYFDQKFKELLKDVTARDPGDGYLEFDEPENQATIGRAERKLGAAWARGLAGDASAKADFDQALEELRQAFMKSINDYKKSTGE